MTEAVLVCSGCGEERPASKERCACGCTAAELPVVEGGRPRRAPQLGADLETIDAVRRAGGRSQER